MQFAMAQRDAALCHCSHALLSLCFCVLLCLCHEHLSSTVIHPTADTLLRSVDLS